MSEEGQDDYQLLEKIAEGQSDALSTLYDRHGGLVYRICRRILHDDQEAEQVLIDVFHELWRRSAQFNPALSNPRTYLVMMARHRSIDRLRRGQRPQPQPLDDSTMPPHAEAGKNNESNDPAQVVLHSEQARHVNDALRGLPDAQRRIIESAFYDGLSHREISEQHNTPLGTVKTAIRRGLARMRQEISRLHAGPPPPPTPRQNQQPHDPHGA